MPHRRSLLAFREPNGQILTEILGQVDGVADLVDPDDGSVRHDGPFVMHGREWQIDSVELTDDLIRVTCLGAATRSEIMATKSQTPTIPR